MRTENNITKRLIKSLKEDNIVITPNITLKLSLLDSAISDYNIAITDIKENGLLCQTNNGKTICQNPAYKIKSDSARLILKILKDLGLTDENKEEIDDFIKSLTQ